MSGAKVFVCLLCPLIHICTSVSFPERNSATVRNIFMVLGRIIEYGNKE